MSFSLFMALQEGVEAPPEESLFDCADSDVTSTPLTFDTYEEGPPVALQAAVNVEELEKRMLATSSNTRPGLYVAELEAQLRSLAVSRTPGQPNEGIVLGSTLTRQLMSPQPSSLFNNAGASGSSHMLNEVKYHQPPPAASMTGSTFSDFLSFSNVQKYKFMTQSEIDKILAFQVQNTHIQNPYTDDYYYTAFMKKYRRGVVRFSPSSMKDLEHQEQSMKSDVKFADLQGLGKIPFSNLRTPRPLIDFMDNESIATAEEEEGVQSLQWEYIRSAQRAQAMHARKLIEDSMCLLLEVDDVDRLAISDVGKVDLRKLATRRRELIGTIVTALRIPSTPEGIPSGGRFNSDGVFLRFMSIAKGRSLLAKLLNSLVPPRPFQALPTDTKPLSFICWATLRNIRALFGPTTWITRAGIDVDMSSLTAETVKIAVGLTEVFLALKSASDVCKALEALAKGDLMSSDGSFVTPEELLLPFLPPNHVPGTKTGIWLEAVLVALLQRALEVGLAQRVGFTHPTGAYTDFDLMKKWDYVFAVLYEAVTAHLKILVKVQRVAKERNQPQALQYAKGLAGRDLLSAILTLCSQRQFSAIKQIVNSLLEW